MREYNYTYEEGRLIRATESEIASIDGEIILQKTLVNTIRYYYDNEGKLLKKVLMPEGGTEQTIFYDAGEDNTVAKFDVNGRTVTAHSKTDSFGRKVFDEIQLGTSYVSRQFYYHTGNVSPLHTVYEKVKSAPTTHLVSQITLSDDTILLYTYDNEERITQVMEMALRDGNLQTTTTHYSYDALGQLTEEIVNDTPVNTVTYDNYGNIQTKNGKQYSYHATWRDLLICYDGQEITYDHQGNPLSYLGHTLTWEKGRQLKSYDGYTYTYNANGIRTSKTVNGVTHNYILDGTKILRESWKNGEDDYVLTPLYDNEDSVLGILYNNVPYYFLKNLQGDVIAILDQNAQMVVRYSYDAWGMPTIQQDDSGISLAFISPYLYRSYYFDWEIGKYYLQSRYYDPVTGRFVNSDFADIITNINAPSTNNLFCYCCNNPVNETDACGNLLASTVGKFFLYALFGLFVQFVSDVIEFLLRKIVMNKDVSFSMSPLGDYLGSALSWGMCVFDLFKNRLATFLAPFLPVAIKHIVNAANGSFAWQALIVDLIAAFVAGIISLALNKSMKDKLNKVKRGKGNRYSDYAKYLKKQVTIKANINKSFFKASIKIVISTTLMQLLLNLLLK